MKRARGLWPKVHSFENLLGAAHRAARGKRYRDEVGSFLVELEPNLFRLQASLVSGSWSPGPFHVFEIREPKVRRICAAPFADRVVHHALGGVVEPVLEAGYVFDSYACRKGKGTHRAVARAQQFARRFRYVLKLDIRKYFSSVDHSVVNAKIARKFKDEEVLALFARIVEQGEPGLPAGVGLPIGNLTSQYLANLYLDSADHLVKEQLGIPGYLRYMDDILLFSNSKAGLWDAFRELELHLNHELRLRVKPKSVRLVPCCHGFGFLGFRIFPGTIRILRANWRRFARNFSDRSRQYEKGEIDIMAWECSVRSMVEFMRLGNTRNLRNTVLNQGL